MIYASLSPLVQALSKKVLHKSRFQPVHFFGHFDDHLQLCRAVPSRHFVNPGIADQFDILAFIYIFVTRHNGKQRV